MSNPVSMLRTIVDKDDKVLGKRLWIWCPGCADWGSGLHALPVEGEEQPQWQWDGNLEFPTLSPSILTKFNYGDPPEERVCHSFLKNGVWDFLGDCTHSLVGQKVLVVPLPDWCV